MRVRTLLVTTLSALAASAVVASPPDLPPDVPGLFPPAYSGANRAPEPKPKVQAKTTRKPVPRPDEKRPVDPPVRRAAAEQGVVEPVPLPAASVPIIPEPLEAGQSIALEAALYGAITNNPDLVTLRNSNVASAEAVEVARRFPTALNPTVWIDYRPITLIPRDTFGTSPSSTTHPTGPFYHYGQNYFLISLRQPIELGHQTTHRYEIARAALNQQQWTVMQAELLTMVQTYRFFQTAAYRRERLRVARNLSESNEKLVQSLRQRLEANQAIASDVVLAEVENEATRQQVDVARQDYANALADLRNQVGMPETAATAEPLGEFVLPRNIPPLDENSLIQIALCSRPDIHAARAAAKGAWSAINLARGDRIPSPIVGPQYAYDEAGIQYIGLILVAPIPIWNSGKPLVHQREAEYRRALEAAQQAERRAVVQVKAATAKWNAANRLVNQTAGLTANLRGQVDRMERLFEANQTDVTRLFQTRQRLIQLENAELDALWQATQAHADLLVALGAPNLIAALREPVAVPPAPANRP